MILCLSYLVFDVSIRYTYTTLHQVPKMFPSMCVVAQSARLDDNAIVRSSLYRSGLCPKCKQSCIFLDGPAIIFRTKTTTKHGINARVRSRKTRFVARQRKPVKRVSASSYKRVDLTFPRCTRRPLSFLPSDSWSDDGYSIVRDPSCSLLLQSTAVVATATSSSCCCPRSSSTIAVSIKDSDVAAGGNGCCCCFLSLPSSIGS